MTGPALSCADLVADLRGAYPERAAMMLKFGDCAIRVAADPGKTKIKDEFVDLPDGRIVRKRLTGMAFLFGKNRHAAVGLCEANLNQVVNFINNRYIEWELCRGALLGHAAGVISNMKSTGLFFLPYDGCAMPDPTEALYADVLSACTVLEIAGGIDFDAAAKEILAWSFT